MNQEEYLMHTISDLREQVAEIEEKARAYHLDMQQEIWAIEEEIEELTVELEGLVDDSSS